MRWEALLNLEPGARWSRCGCCEPTAPRRGAPRIGRRFSAGSQKQKGIPVPEGRGEAARKLLFSTKNRKAWSLFSAKPVLRIIFRPRRLTLALRYGADLESSVTGAEAPACSLDI